MALVIAAPLAKIDTFGTLQCVSQKNRMCSRLLKVFLWHIVALSIVLMMCHARSNPELNAGEINQFKIVHKNVPAHSGTCADTFVTYSSPVW